MTRSTNQQRPVLRTVLCPQCESARLRASQCKLICDACGYVESCEDNFAPTDPVSNSHGQTAHAAADG